MVLSVLKNILFYKYSHRYYLFTNIYTGSNIKYVLKTVDIIVQNLLKASMRFLIS